MSVMKKILLVGLPYDTNIGDQVIFECSKQLLKDVLTQHGFESDFIDLDMFGRTCYNDQWPASRHSFGFVFRRYYYALFHYRKRHQKLDDYVLKKELNKHLSAIDWDSVGAIVFAGGGILKYKYQDFFTSIDVITLLAEKHSIPIMFSAVGIEDYDDKNEFCQIIKKAINRSCVKTITTRDDLHTLENDYIVNRQITCALVSDPACSVARLFPPVNRESFHRGRKTIGLGICRDQLFRDNGVDFSKEDQLQFWKELYDGLTLQGYECRFFTNGHPYDYAFAEEVVDYVCQDRKLLLDRPETASDLMEQIQHFDATIVCRLHASIISYSYNIPTIGIIWNDKQSMFGRQIHATDRFTEPKDALDHILSHTKVLLENSYSSEGREEYIDSCRNYLDQFISEYYLT